MVATNKCSRSEEKKHHGYGCETLDMRNEWKIIFYDFKKKTATYTQISTFSNRENDGNTK